MFTFADKPTLEAPLTERALRQSLAVSDAPAWTAYAQALRVAGYRLDAPQVAQQLLNRGSAEVHDAFGHPIRLCVRAPQATEVASANVGPAVQPPVDILVVSGLSPTESDPWQAWLEARFPQAGWVRPHGADWPDIDRWADRIDEALAPNASRCPQLVLAHGFGALAVIHHALHGRRVPTAAVLVTPAYPKRFGLDAETIGQRLPYPSTLIAPQGGAHLESPWLQDEDAATWARLWGSRLVDAGRGPVVHPHAVAGATAPWREGEAVVAAHMLPLLACARASGAARHGELSAAR